MNELNIKSYDEIVEDLLTEFARELGVDEISSATDIAIKSKVYANKIEGIFLNQEFILKQSNPKTATDKYLDNWGLSLNVGPRKLATNAIGSLTFSREYPSKEDILIPEGTQVSTNQELYGELINAITTEKGILKAGDLEVTIKAKTVEKGEYTNIPVGGFTIINNPPTGISYVKNKYSFKDGTNTEEDEEYRLRFKKDKFYGTNDAFAKRAREVEGVVYAKTLELNRGPGTADILIASANGIPSNDLVDRVREHILERRPICSDLDVIKPNAQKIDIKVKVLLKEGYNLESIVDGIQVLERIKKSMRKYLKETGIGQIIRIMGIANEIYDLEEVIDVKILQPETNIILDNNSIAIEGDFNVSEI